MAEQIWQEEQITEARRKLVNSIAKMPALQINSAQHDIDTLPIIMPLLEEAKEDIYCYRLGYDRYNPKKDVFKFPRSGLWFGRDDRDEIWGESCAMCGGPGPLVNDHCHLTGLERGRLCHSCNSQEGRNPFSPAWQLWRWAAPGLQLCNGPRYVYGGGWSAPTQHEWLFRKYNIDRLHMPLSELVSFITECLDDIERESRIRTYDMLQQSLAELRPERPT